MEEFNQITRNVTHIGDVALQITGLTYKIQKEGHITDDKMKSVNTLTDTLTTDAKTILVSLEKVEKVTKDNTISNDQLKKDLIKTKTKAHEAMCTSDILEEENKKLKSEIESLHTSLNTSKEFLDALSFDEDFLTSSSKT
jgi:hypothetical protein